MQYTASRRETTMVPADFPVPILAPEVAAFVDCSTVRLRLPVLRYCYASTRMALQYARADAADANKWAIMRSNVLGGEVGPRCDLVHRCPQVSPGGDACLGCG